MPTKNGEIIAPTAVVPAARPICSPEKWSVSPSHVPIVTYHAPHTKYCRNMSADSFTRTVGFIISSQVSDISFAAFGSRFSALGSRLCSPRRQLSAFSSRRQLSASALGSRFSALGSRLLSSQRSALGVSSRLQLSAFGLLSSQLSLSALDSRLSARGYS